MSVSGETKYLGMYSLMTILMTAIGVFMKACMRIICVMIILCMARNVYSADSLGSYEVFGGGLDTCKVYLRLRSGSPEGLRYTMWTAGYLTAANRYIPGIYNIAGQVGLVHIF